MKGSRKSEPSQILLAPATGTMIHSDTLMSRPAKIGIEFEEDFLLCLLQHLAHASVTRRDGTSDKSSNMSGATWTI
jgi:hypothetical protein